MRPFEVALRLLLDLHVLMEAGKSDSPEADDIRDKLDVPYGWCSTPRENVMTRKEMELLGQVSEALYPRLETFTFKKE